MDNVKKLPIPLLQEICIKRLKTSPIYELVKDGTNPDKLFEYKVTALGQCTSGSGHSKKEARHNSAKNLLNILKNSKLIDDNIDDIVKELPQTMEINAVGTLLDICVQRDMPIAQFKIINSTGSSHAPLFTMECRVAHMVRTATDSSKKRAKQIVAQNMIQVLQEINHNEDLMTVATLNTAVKDENDKIKRTYKTYLDIKKSDIKKLDGVRLCDRHNYFNKYDKAIVKQVQTYLNEYTDLSDLDKLIEILSKFGFDYEMEVSDMLQDCTDCVKFKIKCDLDTLFISSADCIGSEIINYLKIMIQ